MTENNKIGVWGAVNKNGFMFLFVNEPIRDIETGKWLGQYYVNSVVYNKMKEMFEKANITWEHDAEYIEFTYK